ncbi:solute carrier family 38 member 8 isoform X4 [Pogoniulus pusillus]|uniref:solute carrier family 38 member 8 isoform X4 n=1 Tax=Pogoniulus pusillus TaxID=488313 RepID=UPI0030B93DE7
MAGAKPRGCTNRGPFRALHLSSRSATLGCRDPSFPWTETTHGVSVPPASSVEGLAGLPGERAGGAGLCRGPQRPAHLPGGHPGSVRGGGGEALRGLLPPQPLHDLRGPPEGGERPAGEVILGTLAACYLTLVIILKYYLQDKSLGSSEPSQTSRASSWASIFSVIPTICFGFQVGHRGPTVPGTLVTCIIGTVPLAGAFAGRGTYRFHQRYLQGRTQASGNGGERDRAPMGGDECPGGGSCPCATRPPPHALQCHEACVAIYSSMRNQSFSHWVAVSMLSMLICLLIYSLTGLYGYLTFGQAVASDVLMSYPGNDPVVIIARLLFGISVVTIYPIVVLLGRSVVRDVWAVPKRGAAAAPEAGERWSRVALTVAWMGTTLVIALFVPDIGKVIELIGGISAFFIFIFPGKGVQRERGRGVLVPRTSLQEGAVVVGGPVLRAWGHVCGGCHTGAWARDDVTVMLNSALVAGLCLVCMTGTCTLRPHKKTALTAWGVLSVLVGAFVCGQSAALAVLGLLR